ncbi:MAG: response regulator [Anaerolineae bacterium]|nr:response regulator [Anaerolineae bacterium]
MNIKILVVDDNEQNRYLLHVLLRGNGYQVETVANSAEALAAARSNPPDLIIADILMPVMDGFSLCRHWKADEQLKAIPFVFYTATYTDPQDEEFALSLGAERFIVKPVEPDDFIQMVRQVIANHEAGDLVVRHEPPSPEPVFYKQYNQTLVHKLEEKMQELEAANRALAQDLAERQQMEQALRAAEARYRALVEQLPAITYIVELGPTRRTVYISPQIEAVLGFSPEAWLADPELWIKQLDPRDREQTVTAVQRADATGAPLNIQYRTLHKSGDVVWLHNLSQRISLADEPGRVHHRHGVMFDITARKQLQDQYLQAQKMEAIGQLTAGIAHDFNNLLTVINGFAGLMKQQLSPVDPVQEMVDKILLSGERAANLVRQLLTFSRKQITEPQVLDLNRVVTGMKAMLERIIGEQIQVETHLATDLWSIEADLTQMEQIIVNLVVNARDVMPQGGRLVIETANIVLDTHFTATHLAAKPGKHVLLSISDTGPGMTPDMKERLFEPFFTTKEQGTGLGLATVYGIVKQSGGQILVYSELGQGTIFKIYLPRVEASLSVSEAKQPEADTLDGTETVLLVEDDFGVRQMVGDTLRAHGYRVLVAEEPETALLLAAAHEAPIHLLLTDVIMPQMNGRELYQRLAAQRAGLKVLFMSGYTHNVIAPHEVLQEDTAFLQKPFAIRGLLQKVRTVLG